MAYQTSELLAAFRTSGLSQKEFCSQKGLAVSALQYHLAKERKQRNREKENEASGFPAGSFVPLHLRASAPRHRKVLLVEGEFDSAEIAELIRAASC